MRIYYDCEFLDDGSTVKLISIGMVREDGKEYYAINANMPWYDIMGHNWLRANVVPSLPTRMTSGGFRILNFDSPYVKPKKNIADEVRAFIQTAGPDVELWAWYAAYDHVALCQLWGSMVDLPTGIPQWTNDVRQEFERVGNPRGPAQASGRHNALADAQHSKVMHEFIRARDAELYREAVLEALHPEIGYWCTEGALHSGLPSPE